MPKSPAVRSPLSWVGGKYRLAEKIIALFPSHTLYVEPFGGAAHVLFRKAPSKAEIYNDINSSLVCFFSVVKDKEKCQKPYDLLDATPYSREVFAKSLDRLNSNVISDTERAYSFAVVNWQCFGGLMETWGVGLQDNKTAQTFANKKELLAGACDRLAAVQLENSDFRYILKRYDRPDTLFYLDPPYAWDNRSARHVYENELSQNDHGELVDMLLNLRGKAVLSGYDTPLYAPLERAGWEKIPIGDVAVAMNMKIGEARVRKEEWVWVRG